MWDANLNFFGLFGTYPPKMLVLDDECQLLEHMKHGKPGTNWFGLMLEQTTHALCWMLLHRQERQLGCASCRNSAGCKLERCQTPNTQSLCKNLPIGPIYRVRCFGNTTNHGGGDKWEHVSGRHFVLKVC